MKLLRQSRRTQVWIESCLVFSQHVAAECGLEGYHDESGAVEIEDFAFKVKFLTRLQRQVGDGEIATPMSARFLDVVDIGMSSGRSLTSCEWMSLSTLQGAIFSTTLARLWL